MNTVLLDVLQPDPIVPLGRYEQLLAELQVPVRVTRLWQQPLPEWESDQPQSLLILGGRMSALDGAQHPWLAQLTAQLPRLVAAGTPIFGICLGHQILANALGGKVTVASEATEEDGPTHIKFTEAATSDPVFMQAAATFPTGLELYESHHDAVTRLPAGAVMLAGSRACAVQAMRCQNAWSVQFHPEASPQIMAEWTANEGGDAEAMRAACVAVDAAAARAGELMLRGFVQELNKI